LPPVIAYVLLFWAMRRENEASAADPRSALELTKIFHLSFRRKSYAQMGSVSEVGDV